MLCWWVAVWYCPRIIGSNSKCILLAQLVVKEKGFSSLRIRCSGSARRCTKQCSLTFLIAFLCCIHIILGSVSLVNVKSLRGKLKTIFCNLLKINFAITVFPSLIYVKANPGEVISKCSLIIHVDWFMSWYYFFNVVISFGYFPFNKISSPNSEMSFGEHIRRNAVRRVASLLLAG